MGDLVPITDKLGKLIPRLGTDADGEVVATVRAIGRALQSHGCDWHDLAAALKPQAPAPLYRQNSAGRQPMSRATGAETFLRMALWLQGAPFQSLSDRSRSFVNAMVRTLGAGTDISTKQKRYLADLFAKNGGCW